MAGVDGMDDRFCDFFDDEAEDAGELEEPKVTVEEAVLKDLFCTRTGGHTKQMKLNLIDAAYEQTDKLEELAAPDDKPFFQRMLGLRKQVVDGKSPPQNAESHLLYDIAMALRRCKKPGRSRDATDVRTLSSLGPLINVSWVDTIVRLASVPSANLRAAHSSRMTPSSRAT